MLERCDAPVNVEALAEELSVGYSHFRKAFRAEIGMSPKQFHLKVRLQKARDFLANTDKSLKQISEILGFNSQFHLSAQFKAEMGVSPSEWRRKQI
jgi:transcriptional regulator GlxA family with amidase domain